MRVLIACEYSATVREAFAKRGHDAWSCDLLSTEVQGQHFQCPVDRVLDERWDLIIAHPPCTLLTVAGARWWKGKEAEQRDAVLFARQFEPYADRVAVENPIGHLSRVWRKPDQIIQPWQFGHGEVKATCLWLKGLPKLTPTKIVGGREARVHRMPPGPNRAKERSRTYAGIAEAMAQQWGTFDMGGYND